MSNLKPAEKIREEILRKYNKNPKNWYVFVGIDSEKYFNTFFLHDYKEIWMIKEFALNPYKFDGLGCKVRVKNKETEYKGELNFPFTFGLHEVKKEERNAILNGNFSVIEKILSRSPLPFDEIKNSAVIEGPIILHNKKIRISKAQEDLEKKLQIGIKKLIYREYPDLLKAYV